MIVRNEKPYYYTATIYRAGKKCSRQGTVNADCDKEALDRIYDMGRSVWKRPVIDIVLMDPKSGEILATSKNGDKEHPLLLPDYSTEKTHNFHRNTDNFNDKHPAGFTSWEQDHDRHDPQNWSVTMFGTYFAPDRFNNLHDM